MIKTKTPTRSFSMSDKTQDKLRSIQNHLGYTSLSATLTVVINAYYDALKNELRMQQKYPSSFEQE